MKMFANGEAGIPTNPNKLSLSLLNAITDKTKTKPNIRVGGSSL